MALGVICTEVVPIFTTFQENEVVTVDVNYVPLQKELDTHLGEIEKVWS